MVAKPYVGRSQVSKVSPGWSVEISGTYLAGLVLFGCTVLRINDSAQVTCEA